MIFAAFKQVFTNLQYLIMAGLTTFVVFTLLIWLPNLNLVFQIVSSSVISWWNKFTILMKLLGAIRTNFTLLSASYTISIAVLFGINVAMIIYSFKRQKQAFQKKAGLTSSTGLISAVLGTGCSACGVWVLGLLGTGSFIAILPLGGQEFGILGVGMLITSIFLVAKRIQEPIICKT